MKKLILLLLVFLLTPITNLYATTIKVWADWKITYVVDWIEIKAVNRWEFFDSMFGDLETPKSYEYIELNYKWLKEDSEYYKVFQKLVYFDLIENKAVNLQLDKQVSRKEAKVFIEKVYGVKFANFDKLDLNKPLTTYDVHTSKKLLEDANMSSIVEDNGSVKFGIFYDVYNTILDWHFDKETLDEDQMMDEAIKWLAEWTGDKYTTYFPPIESEDFRERIDWTFEWIWAYVNMRAPWEFMIEGIISWAPSEKAGIKAWDQVLKVWDKEVVDTSTQWEVISWIKWPKWTKVVLEILRDWEVIEVEVTRDVVKVEEVRSEIMPDWTYYIKITMFNSNVANDFIKELENIKKTPWIGKIIIDLRSNPGGLLWEVSKMLDYVVPAWEPKIVVKWPGRNERQYSKWKDVINFDDYKVVVLVNENSASASEILAWTMKDYIEDMVIVWKTSYGKWSVQSIKEYLDGSSLKFTIAKWYTGWTETWIDWIWIIPDIEVELDEKMYKETKFDSQLQKALEY